MIKSGKNSVQCQINSRASGLKPASPHLIRVQDNSCIMALDADATLLEHFEREIWSKIPHLEKDEQTGTVSVAGATPLVDISNDLRECARTIYKIELSDDLKVMGKLDSKLLTGSIKVRPAVHIIHNAIKSGRLRSGQTVIEATSGNFGIALGLLARLGLQVIALVSRRLQEGVFDELRNENVKIIDLDMDICPAPGMKGNRDEMAARATASNIRSQMLNMGFAPEPFDAHMDKILELLGAQDIIELAKLLAEAYQCFCPAQYENSLNPEAHKTITAVEIDEQLAVAANSSLDGYHIVCTFGTGGTSSGFNEYMQSKYNQSAVHVIFPPPGQDVAGIRTQATADGLAMYRPGTYAGEHIVDFEKVRPLHRFFVTEKGHDIGESSALAIHAAMTMSQSGISQKFIVILADGIAKYKKAMEAAAKMTGRIQVSLEDAAQSVNEYDKIVWVHSQYTPQEEGIEVIARSLGVEKNKISVQKASAVGQLLTTQKVPEEMSRDLKGEKGKCLLICMAGNTSLMATKVLAGNGITTESLDGGITGLPESMAKSPGQLVKVATE